MTPNGFKDATTDPARIRTFLAAASEPNYGMLPPEGVFVWDVDTDEERARLARLATIHGELPPTLHSRTANGEHVFWRWPDGHPRPLRRMFGMVTRWGSGQQAGYVIGPRSVHATGVEYAPAEGTAWDIATLPEEWAVAAATGDGTVRVSGGTPEVGSVHAGSRHDFLRDRARFLRGAGLEGEALFAAVSDLNERYCDPPKTPDEVRRAIGDVETRFQPDPVDAPAGAPDGAAGVLDLSATAAFPDDPSDVAFDGFLGECIDALVDGTDASRVAMLSAMLACCGALVPAIAYFQREQTTSPFIALVGESSVGRKGTAMFRVRDAIGDAIGIDKFNRVKLDGVASGEALIRSLAERQSTRGATTALVFEEEFASTLAAMAREGSNLDMRMRSAFDGDSIAHRRVNGAPIELEAPYWMPAIVAITPRELRERLPSDSSLTGMTNRWLWVPVRRREVRASGSRPQFTQDQRTRIQDLHQASTRSMQLHVDDAVGDLLSDYDELLREQTGNEARMTRRYSVIAFRIGLTHAAMEGDTTVRTEHVYRAIALTEYARSGIEWVFGQTAGNKWATYLLRHLEEGPLAEGVISRGIVRHPLDRQAAIDELLELGLAYLVKVPTGGRPRTELHRTPRRERTFATFARFAQVWGASEGARNVQNARKRSESVAKGARKVRESRAEAPSEEVIDTSTGEVQPLDEATWSVPCRDYEAHRGDSHRRGTDGRWACLRCQEEGA